MKYRDHIHGESAGDNIIIDKLDSEDYRERIIKSFEFSETFEEFIIPRICYELDLEATHETKGLQVVGNYGTGKSHLMSLISIIAEDAHYLEFVTNQKAKDDLQKIAGRYKVIRFEIAGKYTLWEMVTFQIDKYLKEWGVDYSICDDDRPVPYDDKLEKMLGAFEDIYPDKGFMILIDEMLLFLLGHTQPDLLLDDMIMLQSLCRISNRTKFRIVFGVQQPIFQIPEFGYARDMLNKVANHLCTINTMTKPNL